MKFHFRSIPMSKTYEKLYNVGTSIPMSSYIDCNSGPTDSRSCFLSSTNSEMSFMIVIKNKILTKQSGTLRILFEPGKNSFRCEINKLTITLGCDENFNQPWSWQMIRGWSTFHNSCNQFYFEIHREQFFFFFFLSSKLTIN